jgi:hypothetical protein
MPAAFGRTLGTAVATASANSLVITTSAAASVGEWIVVEVACDNLNATTPTITAIDSAGNTYTRDVGAAVNATGAAGIAGAILSAPCTNALASGQTITVQLSGAVAHKAAIAQAYTGVGGRRASGATSATGASTSPTVTNANPVSGDLVVGGIAHESRTAPSAYDTDTSNGSWTAGAVLASAAGGTDNTRAQIIYQHKIVTGTGSQTYNATVTSAEWVAMIVAYLSSTAHTGSDDDTVGIVDSKTWEQARDAYPVGITDGVTADLTVAGGGDLTEDDPVGLSDSVAYVHDSTRTDDDAAGLVDSLEPVKDSTREITDPVGLVDSASSAGTVAHDRSEDDPVGIVDDVSGTITLDRSDDDTVGLTDAITVTVDYVRGADDTVGLLDPKTWALESDYEPVGIVDSITVDHETGVPSRTITDNVGIEDQGATEVRDVAETLTDPVGLTDSVSVDEQGAATRSDDDPVGVTDAISRTIDAVRAVTDPVGLVDGISVAESGAGESSVTDPVGVTDAISRTISAARGEDDPVGLTDSRAQAHDSPRTEDDPVGISDSVSYDEVAGLLSATVTDQVGVTDSRTTARDHVRTVTDSIGLADSTTTGGAFIYSRTVSDGVGLLDSHTSAGTFLYTRTISDPVGLTDQAFDSSTLIVWTTRRTTLRLDEPLTTTRLDDEYTTSRVDDRLTTEAVL